MVDEHRLVPRDAQLQLRVGESDPHHYVDHPLTVVVVGDGREVLVERLDCHGFTLTTPMHICGTCGDGSLGIGRCTTTWCANGDRPWFPTGGPQQPNAQHVLGRLKADNGGVLGGHRHVLGRGREPDDVRAVVGEHRLVPRDAQLQLRLGEPHPHQYVYQSRSVVVVRDGQ